MAMFNSYFDIITRGISEGFPSTTRRIQVTPTAGELFHCVPLAQMDDLPSGYD